MGDIGQKIMAGDIMYSDTVLKSIEFIETSTKQDLKGNDHD